MVWAVDHGAKVINASYGPFCGDYAIESAAKYVESKGGLMFLPEGNGGVDYGYSNSPYLVCVSATDSNDARASWSSFGKDADLSAPGVNIFTTTRGVRPAVVVELLFLAQWLPV